MQVFQHAWPLVQTLQQALRDCSLGLCAGGRSRARAASLVARRTIKLKSADAASADFTL
jgi:hypothetical protein